MTTPNLRGHLVAQLVHASDEAFNRGLEADAAEQCGQHELARTVRVELADWNALAERVERQLDALPTPEKTR